MATDRIALPTENFELFSRSLAEFTRLVEENEQIIARIGQVTDIDLTYPQTVDLTHMQKKSNDLSAEIGPIELKPPHQEISDTHKECGKSKHSFLSSEDHIIVDTEREKTPGAEPVEELYQQNSNEESNEDRIEESNKESNEESNEDDNQDALREYLDQTLGTSHIPVDEVPLDTIENKRLRDLLKDNIRLAKLKSAKLKLNHELLKVLQGYELLMAQVILPHLSEEVSGRNLELTKRLRDEILPELITLKLKIWKLYSEFFSSLDQIKNYNTALSSASAGIMELPSMDRLGAELTIVSLLLKQSQIQMGQENL